MGVLPIIALILVMKIPILGLIWFVFSLMRESEAEPPAEAKLRRHKPRRPEPPQRRGPRRRGPHGGGAVRPLPSGHAGRAHAPATARRTVAAIRH
jgi:hypothetical protein